MSIEKQKKLLFVPIVNFLVSGISFLKMFSEKNLSPVCIFRLLFKCFLFVIVITILEVAIGSTTDIIWVKSLISLSSSYLFSLFISYSAIKEQERNL